MTALEEVFVVKILWTWEKLVVSEYSTARIKPITASRFYNLLKTRKKKK